MTAIDLPERRTLHRYALSTPLVSTLNGHGVMLVDLSLRGTRIRHTRGFALGACRLRFRWDDQQFDDVIQIVASTAVPGETIMFESRVRFGILSRESSDVIKHAITALDERKVADWLANLRGDYAGTQSSDRASAGFIGYVLNGSRWRRLRVDRDDELLNGFVVVATRSLRVRFGGVMTGACLTFSAFTANLLTPG